MGLNLTYIGGPTAIVEFAGARLLTDPTFDAAGGEYPSGPATLRKLADPVIAAAELPEIDYVLLSHDQHFDNLDRAGRALLPTAKSVLTTAEGAARLGGNSTGLKPWQSIQIPVERGPALQVVATPARHGPAGSERGAVIGFVLQSAPDPGTAVYFSGDTVWYEGVAEVARRFPVRIVILNLGAARVKEVGDFHLTMTAAEAVQAAKVFADAAIVPLHFEGWEHFSEGRAEIEEAFAEGGLSHRLVWPVAGKPLEINIKKFLQNT